MLQIDTLQDLIDSCKLREAFHESVVSFIGEFFNQLRQSLNQERASFRLSDHGYKLFVLMPEERLSDSQLHAWFSNVEHAERIFLGDCELVKICLMEDNESFNFFFTIAGTQTEDVENWFSSLFEGGVQP